MCGTSQGHTLIDLGDDVFTRGRPHPMIDHRLRNERLLQEAADPEVAVILFDVVLGYGAHPDPAAELPRDQAAQAAAREPRAARRLRRLGLRHRRAIRRTSRGRKPRCARPACCSRRATPQAAALADRGRRLGARELRHDALLAQDLRS